MQSTQRYAGTSDIDKMKIIGLVVVMENNTHVLREVWHLQAWRVLMMAHMRPDACLLGPTESRTVSLSIKSRKRL